MHDPDCDYDNFDDDEEEFLYFDDDPLKKKKRLTLSDFLPKTKACYEPIDWGTDRKQKPVRLIVLKMANGDTVFVDDLRLAVINGNMELVKSLMAEAKVSPDIQLKDDWTPLLTAAHSAQTDVLMFLLEAGADPNIAKKGFTPLMSAVCADPECSVDEVEDRIISCINPLVKFGAKIDAGDLFRTTALHFAVKNNRVQVAECLLSHKANVNAQDNWNHTALHIAAKYGFGRMIRLLMESGADLNLSTDSGLRPEDMAAAAGFPEISNMMTRCRKDKSLITPSNLNLPEPDPNEKVKLGNGIRVQDEDIANDVAKVLLTDMQLFLRGFGLADVESDLMKHDINSLPQLLKLREEDVDRIGILSDRKKDLMAAIGTFSSNSWSRRSDLPEVVPKSKISSPELYNFLVNVTRQLEYIEATLTVVERNMSEDPVSIQKNMDQIPADGLQKGYTLCCNNVNKIQNVLSQLASDFLRAKKLGVKRADFIGEEDISDGRERSFRLPMLLTAGTVFCALLFYGCKHFNLK